MTDAPILQIQVEVALFKAAKMIALFCKVLSPPLVAKN